MHEWLSYLLGRLKDIRPTTVDVNGQPYAVKENGTLGEPVRGLAPQWVKPTLTVNTLGALAELYRAKIDDFEDDTAISVDDYLHVSLVRLKADEFGRRHVYARAVHAEETPFTFNRFMAPDKFNIDFRASFYLNDEAIKVLTVVSNLESGQQIAVADDGLSQKIEIKQETRSNLKTPVTLPADGIPLIPWRTFREADPVESRFLLRLQMVKDAAPAVALFEIDQKWKLDTAHSVADWLRNELPENTTVIA